MTYKAAYCFWQLLTTANLLISCLPVVTCLLKPSSVACWGAVHLLLSLFIFYSDHAHRTVSHKSSAPSDAVSPQWAEWSRRRRGASSWGLWNWCALLAPVRVTLKNQKHSASGTATVSPLINLNPPLSSPPRYSDFGAVKYQVLMCLNSWYVRAGWKNATQPWSQIVCALLHIEWMSCA